MKDSRVQYFANNMDRLSRRDRVFLNNPVVMQGLGLAPIVVAATTVQNGLVLAVAVALLLTPTRMLATFMGRLTKGKFRGVLYVITSGVVYIGVCMAVERLFGQAMRNVGIYLPLLVVEPLILKRYESPQKERISTSFKKGFVTTIGYCLVLMLVATLREILAAGTFAGFTVFSSAPFPMMGLPAGGFIMVGLIAAIWRGLVFNFKKRVSLGVKELQ